MLISQQDEDKWIDVVDLNLGMYRAIFGSVWHHGWFCGQSGHVNWATFHIRQSELQLTTRSEEPQGAVSQVEEGKLCSFVGFFN